MTQADILPENSRHTHGGEYSRWESEALSGKDYSGFVKPFNLDLFLLTPDNSFRKLDHNGDVDMVLPEADVK